MGNAFSHVVAGWGCESNRQIGFVSFVRARVRSCVGARAVRERFSNRWLGRIQSSAYFSPYFCVPGMGRWDPCDIILRGGGWGVKLELSISIFRISDFWKFHSFWIFDCRFSDCWSTQGNILIFSIFNFWKNIIFIFELLIFWVLNLRGLENRSPHFVPTRGGDVPIWRGVLGCIFSNDVPL